MRVCLGISATFQSGVCGHSDEWCAVREDGEGVLSLRASKCFLVSFAFQIARVSLPAFYHFFVLSGQRSDPSSSRQYGSLSSSSSFAAPPFDGR